VLPGTGERGAPWEKAGCRARRRTEFSVPEEKEATVRKLVIALLTLLVLALPAAANMVETVDDSWNDGPGQFVPGPVFDWGRDILYDNGPVNNMPGLSVLQVDLGMNTYGFGHQFIYDYRIADGFVIPVGENWQITSITFFAYQTNSPTSPSTITGVHLQIWDDFPGNAGASIVWGDLVTNVLAASVWTEIYRVPDYDMTLTNRPIMANTCNVPITLGPGEYWLDWETDGTLSSGPWAPPIVIWDEIETGDGYQYDGTLWNPAVDSGTSTQQGFPFIIEGIIPTPVEQSSWSAVKALYR
jgi:hypothetical protein